MSRWREVWRIGIAPQFTDAELTALRDALTADSPELGETAYFTRAGGEVYRCCAMSYPLWKCRGKAMQSEMSLAYHEIVAETRRRLAAAGRTVVDDRDFWGWFDRGPRHYVFGELAEEIGNNLEDRQRATMATCVA